MNAWTRKTVNVVEQWKINLLWVSSECLEEKFETKFCDVVVESVGIITDVLDVRESIFISFSIEWRNSTQSAKQTEIKAKLCYHHDFATTSRL